MAGYINRQLMLILKAGIVQDSPVFAVYRLVNFDKSKRYRAPQNKKETAGWVSFIHR